jgi:hypothetical protein
MTYRLIATSSLPTLVLATLGAAVAASAAERPVALSQEPLVMRLSKDEFRIAFGVNAPQAAAAGCNGVIRYRVDWKADDGTQRSESKLVSYAVLPHATRSIVVDRQYFDTSEGRHTTDIVKVHVASINCIDSGASHVPEVARAD